MYPEISINIHSSIRVANEDLVVRLDPFKIPEKLHDTDIVFITHAHYDHFSPEDIRKISKPDTVYVAPRSMEKQLAKQGMTNMILLSPGETSTVRSLPVEAIAAYNILKSFHPKASGCLGYVITMNEQRIYVAGDTDAIKEAKTVRCDIALVPIGGTYTMNAKEAAELVNEMRPRTAIPVHYGAIAGKPEDGEKFKNLVADGIEVKVLLER